MTGVVHGLRLRLRDWVRRRPALHAAVRFAKYGPYRPLARCRVHEDLLARLRGANARILNLGSGGRPQAGMINLDVTPITGPDVVGDGYRLPFADATFDAIFCESVIEHVPDPEAFLRAVTPCLRPGGIWFLEVPFLQPFHGERDFQRWTIPGFRAALERAGLEPIAAGTRMGPGFMIAWLLKDTLALALSLGGGGSRLGQGLAWFLGILFSPLLLLDLIGRQSHPAQEGLACSHYHVARRPEVGS
ncbi:MAG: class I SAM-dependent methyltransferase [Alphaproteobacteria bacterium]